MTDSIERIADEVATYQAPPNGQYIQVHPRVMRDWESRLRALSPAGGDLHHLVWSILRPYIQPAAREKVNAALKEILTASPKQSPAWGDWVMVPREPTPEMIYAYNTADAAPPNHRNLSTSGYLAMLAASPQQEPGAGGECRCHEGNGALHCTIHTQADFDAQQPTTADESVAGLVGIASIPPGGDGATTRALFDARTVPPGTKLYAGGQTLAGAGGCCACGDGCVSRGSCRLADESPNPAPATSAGTTGDDSEDAAMAAIYDDFCAKDNGDVPLERYPQGAVDALARAGWAVVPCDLPFAVLGDAAQAGVFETGNPKHGWDYLVARTRIGPAAARRAREVGDG